MINLLPPEVRSSIAYARKNTKLRSSAIGMVIVLVFMVITLAGGLVLLKQTSRSLAKQIEVSKEQLQVQNQEAIEKDVENLSSTFKLVVEVLSKQVMFSSLIKQVGSAMPPGTVLTSLSINQVSGGLDLQAKAEDFQAATQVQVNLRDPKSLLFEKVDVVNIQCQPVENAAAGTVASRYPCTVQLRALFSKTNPFLFINKEAKP